MVYRVDRPDGQKSQEQGEENILVAWGKWGVEQGVIKGKFGHQGKEEQAGGVFLFAGGVEEASINKKQKIGKPILPMKRMT